MKKNNKPLLCFLMLGLTPQCAWSDELFEDEFFSELPVITSASRLNQSVLSSPSAVTVIDSAMIQASGFIEVADIFRLVPGFQVAHVDGSTYAVINHGDGWDYPNRMQLLIDGRSTYTNAISAIDWNTLGIQIEDIDRIEVVRGPAASAYGANSFAGAINIITKVPELDHKWQFRTRFGNKGEEAHLLRHSNQIGKFSYRITAAHRQNEGLDDDFNEFPSFDDDDRLFNDFAFSGSYSIDTKNSVYGHISSTNGHAEMLNIDLKNPTGFYDRARDTEAISAHLRWDHIISETKELHVNFYHNFRDEDDMVSSYPLYQYGNSTLDEFNLVNEFLITPQFGTGVGSPYQTFDAGERTYKSHRSDLEIQYNEILDNGIQYVVGLGGRYDTMESEAFFPEKGTVSNTGYRAFANVQVPLGDKFTANAGGFYEVNRTDEPHFSPRLSLTWHIKETQSLRVGYSKAYRIPSLLEENFDLTIYSETGVPIDYVFLSDAGIEAERVKAFDIGYVGRMESFPLSWELRAYKEEYDNVIDFYNDECPSTDTSCPVILDVDGLISYLQHPTNLDGTDLNRIGNVTQSQMYGFEGSIFYRPEKNSFIRFHFNRGHETGTYIKEVNELSGPSTDVVSLHNGAPRKSYGILAAKAIGSWQFNVGLYHVGKMQWFDRGDEVDSYTRLDASIIKRLALGAKDELIFRIGGQNIGNEKYSEFDKEDDRALLFEPRYFASITYLTF